MTQLITTLITHIDEIVWYRKPEAVFLILRLFLASTLSSFPLLRSFIPLRIESISCTYRFIRLIRDPKLRINTAALLA